MQLNIHIVHIIVTGRNVSLNWCSCIGPGAKVPGPV